MSRFHHLLPIFLRYFSSYIYQPFFFFLPPTPCVFVVFFRFKIDFSLSISLSPHAIYTCHTPFHFSFVSRLFLSLTPPPIEHFLLFFISFLSFFLSPSLFPHFFPTTPSHLSVHLSFLFPWPRFLFKILPFHFSLIYPSFVFSLYSVY